LHTAIHHICEKVAQQVKINSSKALNSIFVTGGGALNHFLIEVLQEKLGKDTTVIVPEKELIEFKEATVFALMGALRMDKIGSIMNVKQQKASAYWKENLRYLVILLSIWFAVSYGAGILFKEALDTIQLGGFKLGFWFAQQGSIYVFVILIFVYVRLMNKLDKKYGYDE